MSQVQSATKNPIKLAILGGGVAGITLASELSKYSIFEINIIEKSSVLGGLHRNVNINNLNYDIGLFLFSNSYGLFEFYPKIADLYVPVNSQQLRSSLTSKGNIDRYPMSVEGYIEDYGLLKFLYAGVEIIVSKLIYYKRNTLSSWIKYYIGNTIYQDSGLKTYIERLYGTSDENIDIEFATKRLSAIKRVGSLRKILSKIITLKNTEYFFKNNNSKFSKNSSFKTLVRPKEGFGKVYNDIIKNDLISKNVSVFTDCQLKAIKITDKEFEIEFSDNRKILYDRLISTIPLEALSFLTGKPLDFQIEYRGLCSFFYRFNGELGYETPVLNNFTKEGEWKRIITFSKYYGTYEGDDYFAVEITIKNSDELNKTKLRENFESHVKRLGLFKGELKYQGDTIIKNAYPCYSSHLVERVAIAKKVFRKLGTDLVGRQGEFDYISANDAIINAKKLAEKIKANYGI